ncbi:MAG: lipopolysaccharide heptosyltransferase II [Candidatus Omnitrophica bacterium]|nr:lipopolysaccharide heptosyltransferase II [Candidatus Omnitrophota bacterium]
MKSILIVTLSNIGDAVLTLPVLAHLADIFPKAKITLLAGPRVIPVYIDDNRVSELIIYDKHTPLRSKIALFWELRARKFDLIIDFKNSLIPILLGAKRHTSFWRKPPKNIVHKQQAHLWKLKSLGLDIDTEKETGPLIWLNPADHDKADQYLSEFLLNNNQEQLKIIALAPGAMSHLKRWPIQCFADLASRLLEETDVDKIILLGSKAEKVLCAEVEEKIYKSQSEDILNLAGQTTLKEAAALLTKCKFLVSNDSALMHIAGSIDIPVIALFGPTDENKYKPLSPNSLVITNELNCRPCQAALCPLKTHECLQQISADKVFEAILDKHI